MSLISLTVTTYTLCPLSTIKWLMCENGMNPRVPLSSKGNAATPTKQYLGTFQGFTSKFLMNTPITFLGVPSPLYPRNEESNLFD